MEWSGLKWNFFYIIPIIIIPRKTKITKCFFLVRIRAGWKFTPIAMSEGLQWNKTLDQLNFNV